MKLTDPVQKSKELAKVAEKPTKAEKSSKAKTTLAVVAADAKAGTVPSIRATCLNTVAGAMCRVAMTSDAEPLFSEAAAAVEEIKDPDAKVLPLTSLAFSANTYLKKPDLAAE